MRRWRWAVAVGALGLIWLATRGVDLPSIAADEEPPARVERVEGSDLKRIILTAKAASRLGIQIADVTEEKVADKTAKMVPYAALIYDPTGATWVYTNPQERVFLRHRVVVDNIAADRVVLSEGPAAGVKIVTVGVAELYGVENGLG
ncbi:MAG TPA: hypothetical protein DGT23_24320 [Micromonosporaceae bacterium]|nr:hypothetical protein [Micromonosporaceae bacterium]